MPESTRICRPGRCRIDPPGIATTLVTLGVDLVSCVTMGTLQSGMDYALRRVRGVGLARARSGR